MNAHAIQHYFEQHRLSTTLDAACSNLDNIDKVVLMLDALAAHCVWLKSPDAAMAHNFISDAMEKIVAHQTDFDAWHSLHVDGSE